MTRSVENDDACLAATPEAKLVTYKGYNKDLSCTPNGAKFQYEIGKTYDNGGRPVRRCGDGAFHSCLMPLDVWSYYGPVTSRYTLTELSGEIHRPDGPGDSKIASAKITIGVELSLGELTRRAVAYVAGLVNASNEAQKTTGYGAHSATTGYGAHSATTGYGAHSATTGYRAHSATTGYDAHSATTGYDAHSAVKGANSVAVAVGRNSTATAHEGGAISLAAYDENVWPPKLVAVRSSLVGENGIEAGKKYRLTTAGEFELAE